MSDLEPTSASDDVQSTTRRTGNNNKRRHVTRGAAYPRKRSLKACHVCRARKTKCDNVQPRCGFCASMNIQCTYDDTEIETSSFDAATLEILRQLGKLTESQDDLLQLVRHMSLSASQPSNTGLVSLNPVADDVDHVTEQPGQTGSQQLSNAASSWPEPQLDSASSTPAVSSSLAAIRWFGALTNNVSQPAGPDITTLNYHWNFLEHDENQVSGNLTPLQRATGAVDGRRLDASELGQALLSAATPDTSSGEFSWQSVEDIMILPEEAMLFENFLRGISPWFELFDPRRTFSTRVPRLALRNAGLMNAILALSSYHRSLGPGMAGSPQCSPNSPLQYYYQTLHYVQRAMQYSLYRTSLELTATAIIVSTYEMLHGSSNDWQRHLQGVFWILRSRQIEVERPGLESTIWWAWLQQDIWAAFRDKRRTYSTWTPKKACAELDGHELAARSLWILAQVVNFCAVDPTSDEILALQGRMAWAGQLKDMLREWEACLTPDFAPLPALNQCGSHAFKPHLIYPQCFGLALQAHHVSRLLLRANQPFSGGTDTFVAQQRVIHDSVDMVCGIGLTQTDEASSLLSSQYVFLGKST